jgi:hypothetical protein
MLVFLFACNSSSGPEQKKEATTAKNEVSFNKLLKEFPVISLPLQIRIHQHISAKGLYEVLSDSPENKFFEEKNSLFCYGLLSDTTLFYSLIMLYPADVMVPQLFIFTKKGELISRTNLVAKGCVFECGFRKCTSDCLIDQENQITLVDTNDIYSCDEDGNELMNKRNHYIIRKRLEVLSNGKVKENISEQVDLLSK